MNLNRTSGGYSPSSLAGGSVDHDGQSKRYWRDQLRQRLARSKERQGRLDALLGPEEVRWHGELSPVESPINEATLANRFGKPLTATERKGLIAAAMRDRSWYNRPDGKKERLRSQPWAVDEDGSYRLDNKGQKIREELPRGKVKVVFHEAFRIDPRLSYALVLATSDGYLDLAADYIRLGGQDTREIFEKATGLEVLTMPYHAKALAGHYQPDYVVVDANNKKLGSADALVHLGPKLLGIARWRRMGLTEQFVQSLTGASEGFFGLDDAVEGRGDRAIDLIVENELDQRMLKRLKEPKFEVLGPYFEKASDYYKDYLRRRAEIISQSDARARAEVERAEAVQLANAAGEQRDKSEAARIAAEERAAKAEASEAEARANVRVVERVVEKIVERVPLEVETEMTRLRAEIQRLSQKQPEAGPAWLKWPVNQLFEAIERIATGNDKKADRVLLDKAGRVSHSVREHLRVIRAKDDEEASHAEQAETAISVHDQKLVDHQIELLAAKDYD